MKILSLLAENVKKLSVVEIKPDGHVVEITGPNGSGKSSVLDAIFYALEGGAMPSKPIRRGEKSARIRLDLGEIIVTRKFRESGSTQLIIEAANGARFPNPQKMLDSLLGAISLDPLAFSRMGAKEQYDFLRKLVKVGADLEALAAANEKDFAERTAVNRRAKELRAQAAGIVVPDGLPESEIDVSGLLAKMEQAAEHNGLIERRKANRERVAQDAATQRQQAAGLRERAAELRRQAEQIDQQAHALDEAATTAETSLAEAEPLPTPIDATALRQEIDAAAVKNAGIAQRKRRQEIEAQAAISEKQSEALTAAMAARDEEKRKAIEEAKMPVDGLSFGEGELFFQDIPFFQASSAEQLRVSVAIAMAMNPKLRVLRIKDGSLLDEKSLQLIAEAAGAADYQVWIERVDTSGKVGIVMEDGHVAGHPPPAAENDAPAADKPLELEV
jgi:energy-coupling factor transporter ATP-binding protein EcfA2